MRRGRAAVSGPHAASQTMTAAISRCFDAVESDGRTARADALSAANWWRATRRGWPILCRCAVTILKNCRSRGITPWRVTRPSGAAPPTAVCWPGNPCARQCLYLPLLAGRAFYYVSTNYTLDPVCILHLPGAAKDRQLKLIYNGYARRGVFPPLNKIYRLCGLPAAHPPLLRTLWTRLLAKL